MNPCIKFRNSSLHTYLVKKTFIVGLMGAIMTRVSKNEMETYGKAGAIAEEVISSIRTVIAFGGEDKEVEKYSTEVATARKSGIYRGILTGMNKQV